MRKPPSPEAALNVGGYRFFVLVALLLYLSVLFSMNVFSAHLVAPQQLAQAPLDAARAAPPLATLAAATTASAPVSAPAPAPAVAASAPPAAAPAAAAALAAAPLSAQAQPLPPPPLHPPWTTLDALLDVDFSGRQMAQGCPPVGALCRLQDIFDEIIVISLPRFEQRNKRMFAQLAELDIPYRLVQAHDKRSGAMAGLANHIMALQYNRNPGTLSLFASHLSLLEYVRVSPLRHVLFLEDDCTFASDFPTAFDAAIRTVPADWRALWLGWLSEGGVPNPEAGQLWVRPNAILTSFAIALHRDAAALVQRELIASRQPIDVQPWITLLQTMGAQAYALSPPPIASSPYADSTLGNGWPFPGKTWALQNSIDQWRFDFFGPGYRRGMSQALPVCPVLEEGWDYVEANVDGAGMRLGSTVEECCWACQEDWPRCKFWTLVKKGDFAGCWLKTSNAGRSWVGVEEVVSGNTVHAFTAPEKCDAPLPFLHAGDSPELTLGAALQLARDAGAGGPRPLLAPPLPSQAASNATALIPNVVHFVFGYGGRKFGEDAGSSAAGAGEEVDDDLPVPAFSFFNLVSIASALRVQRPDRVLLHCPPGRAPSGPYWEVVKPYITLMEAPGDVKEIFGRAVRVPAHRADIARLKILQLHGGIYLDLDMVVLRPFDALLRAGTTAMGKEIVWPGNDLSKFGLCNAVIVAPPGAPFLARWLESYRDFDDSNWNEHSVMRPAALAAAAPEEVSVLSERAFFWPSWWQEGQRTMYHSFEYDYADAYAVHLWLSTKPVEGFKLSWLKQCRSTLMAFFVPYAQGLELIEVLQQQHVLELAKSSRREVGGG